MKAAIIGAGFIADFHAAGYAGLPDVQLCAVCDADAARAERMAEEYRCAAYTDAAEMLAREKPDAVSVCLPTWLHAEYTIAALRAGAHVLCEKPMALTMEDCEAMAETAERCGRVLMIGQVLRWWPEYETMAAHIRRLGTPRYLRAQRLQHSSREGWFMDPKRGGGALFDLLVHDLDYMCSVAGQRPAVLAANGSRGPEGSWRRISVSLKWDGGPYGQIDACNCMPAGYPFTAGFRAEYAQAALEYAFQVPLNIGANVPAETRLTLFENGGVEALPTADDAQSRAFSREIAAFIAGAARGVSALPAAETVDTMRLVHEIKAILDQQG